MLFQETINRLQELFNQRAGIEREINSLLSADQETLMNDLPKVKVKKTVNKIKVNKKPAKPAKTSSLLPTPDKEALRAKAETMKAQGMKVSDIAKKLNVGTQTIYNLNRDKWSSAKKPRSKPEKPVKTYEGVPQSSVGHQYMCNDCGEAFTSVLNESEAKCPKNRFHYLTKMNLNI
jgi:DNA invertase Pin-like site-specific DNA recombinase/DNA-directed RNA polymerase subunit RPC12/RpoP